MNKINGFKIMWVMVSFDLPTQTKAQRKRYTAFRKMLLAHGFTMMQYSVYVRHLPTMRKAQAIITKLGRHTPPQGQCAFVLITDKQYGMIRNFYGTAPVPKKKSPKFEQLMLFGESEMA